MFLMDSRCYPRPFPMPSQIAEVVHSLWQFSEWATMILLDSKWSGDNANIQGFSWHGSDAMQEIQGMLGLVTNTVPIHLFYMLLGSQEGSRTTNREFVNPTLGELVLVLVPQPLLSFENLTLRILLEEVAAPIPINPHQGMDWPLAVGRATDPLRGQHPSPPNYTRGAMKKIESR